MWQMRLRDNYENDFQSWLTYSETYGLAERLGGTPEQLWDENPVIQGSVYPKDFRIVSSQTKGIEVCNLKGF